MTRSLIEKEKYPAGPYRPTRFPFIHTTYRMKHALLSVLFSFMASGILYAQGPGCPNINAGNDQTLACGVNCTTLNATAFQTGATSSYTVSAIPYNPPAPTSAWVNSFVNVDDIWSGIINLPFNFCFYGTSYNRLVIGANGVISFNTGYANQFCPWNFNAAIPSPVLPLNAIFGAYHDIDPSVCGNIRYAISGTAPCRTFMFDFNQVCHYNCNNLRTTQRIVLYEVSNAIEVYIGNKPVCAGWNGGRAVIGIQNSGGDIGMVAPGRQTGAWAAANEGWRFTPSGAPNYSINWYSSGIPGVIGTGPSVNVCPTNQFTTYSAVLTYTNCDNSTVTVTDYVNVSLTGPAQPAIYNNGPICAGNTLALNTNVTGATYFWTGPGGWTSNLQNPTRPSATTAMSGTYTLYVVVAGCASSVASQNITILNGATQPTFTASTPLCAGSTLTLQGPAYTGATYVWSGPAGFSPGNVSNPTRPNATAAMSGVYSLYVVVGGCTSATATQNVVINPPPATPAVTSNSPVCTQNTINLSTPAVSGATYVWSGPGGWSSNLQNPSRPNANLNMAGTYSLYIVVGGCSSAVATTNVAVNGPPIPTIDIPQQLCVGETATFNTTVYAGTTYVWSGPGGYTSNDVSPVLTNLTAAATGNYSLYLVQSGCTSNTVTSYMEVIFTPAPVVSSNTPICEGGTINLTSTAVAGATYTWTGPNGFISTTDNPSITAATPAMNGNYSLYVTANGCNSTPSATAVTVNPTPVVNAVGNQTVCRGAQTGAVNFGGTPAGTTYNWTNSNPAIGLAASGSGDIAAFTALNTGTAPISATVTVTPTANGCTGAPVTFTITVNPSPVVNAVAPQTICNGLPATAVIFGSTTPGTTFSWTNNNPAIGLGASGNGDIPAFNGTNTGNTPLTGTVTVTPTANGCAGTPSTFTITVHPTPAATPGTDQTVCNGAAAAAITWAGPVTGTTYNWTNSLPAIGLAAAGTGDIASFNTVNTGTAPVTATVTATPTSNGCTGAPLTLTITVNPTPTVNAVSNRTVCHGAASTVIPFGSPVAGTTYSWTNNTPSIGLAAGGNGDLPAFTAINTGTSPVTATITVTPAANGCTGTPATFTVTVNPLPALDAVAPQTACNGATVGAIAFGSNVAGATYTWTNSNTAVGLAAGGNGNIAAFTAVNTGTAPVSSTVTVTPAAGGCTGTPGTFTVTVNPTPTADAVTPQDVCNGASTAAVTFTGPVTGTTFAWTNDTPSIGLAAAGNGNIAAFTASNTGTAPVAATITVTPAAGGCPGTPVTSTITVNPTPTVNAIAAQTVCSGQPGPVINFGSPVAGTTYTWTNSNPAIGLAASGSSAGLPAFTAANPGTTPISGTVTVTPVAAGCTGTPGTFTITVNPAPTVNAPAPQTVCSGTSVAAVNFTGSIPNTVYNWTNDTPSIGLAASGTGDMAAFTGTNTGNTPVIATITVTPVLNGCTGPAGTFTVTVNPTPVLSVLTPQTVCNGTGTSVVSFGSSVTGTNYSWTNNTTSIGLAGSGNGNIAAFTAVNTGNTPVMATITVTPAANGCTGTPGTFAVTVNPTPTADAVAPQTLCRGGSVSAAFTGPVNGTVFNWTNNNTAIGLAGSGSGNIGPFTALNTGTTPVTSTVTVTPAVNGCTGPSRTFTIRVNPTHTGTPVAATICSGSSYTFGGQSFTAAGSYPVVFQNQYGCDSTVTLNLTVIPATGPPPNGTYFNTGTNGSGGTLPGGAPDAHWMVSNANINGPYASATVMSSTPGSYYNSPWPDCKWISHNASGSHTGNQTYYYRINFDLPCANQCGDSYLNPNAFCLNLDFFTDNSVYEIYVNGVPQSTHIGNMPVPNPYTHVGFSQSGMVSVSLCEGWQPGGNSLVVQVVSGAPYAAFLAQMSVNPPPPISDTSAATICSGQTLAFGTQTLSTAGTYTETFHLPGGCDSTATLILSVNPTYTGNTNAVICNGAVYTFGGQNFTATGNYPVTFQTVNGCDSTVTLHLTVNPTYNTSFSQTICEGTSYAFGGNTYHTGGSYPLTFQTIRGCDSTVTLNLTVNPNPPVVINPVAPQCLTGNSFQFSTAQNFPAGTTYAWTFPGSGTPASASSAPQNVVYPAAGNYSVGVAVTQNGCQSVGSLSLTVLESPDVQFNALPPTGCVPLTVTFTNLTAGGGTLLWDFGTGGVPVTSSPATVTYTQPGQYGVSLTVVFANGCSSILYTPGLIHAQPQPVAGFTVNPNEVAMDNPTAHFNDASTGANSVYYYVQGGNAVPGPNASYHFNAEGTYEVMQVVTSAGGCSDTAYGKVIVQGSTEVYIPNAFTPNQDPVNPGFGISGNGFTDFRMMIFDRWGEMLFDTRDADQKWDGTRGGKVVPPDVYVYKIELRDFKKNLKTYIGSVTLIK